ncbi:MAG: TniQ family protein [Ramlibacter sp.]|nr:TniQ family protein [Ramlibacter sp.]
MALLAAIPQLETDESIYGWCAFAHQLSCSTSSQRTSHTLFGVPHATGQCDLPSSLAVLIEHGQIEGSLEDVLRSHTVAGAYMPFAGGPGERQRIVAAAARRAPLWTRAALQFSRSRHVTHPLRLCPACIEDDRGRLGRPIWHVGHQLPGACCCLTHGCHLHWVKNSGKRFLSPDQAVEGAQRIRCDLQAGLVCAALGRIATGFEDIRQDHLVRATLKRMVEGGIAHSVRKIGHLRLRSWFCGSAVSMLCAAEGSGLANLADGRWIAGQLWRHHHSNAARWIVLWAALEWESRAQAEFSFTCACLGRGLDGNGQETLWDQPAAERAPQKVSSALAASATYAEAMQRLGCSRSDLIRWLDKDSALRDDWHQRLDARRLAYVLHRIHHGLIGPASRPVKEDPDIRWLQRHHPQVYARTGLATSAQRSLF